MTNRIVVCGAGSAGSILAARLSQDPDNSVILLEAGPNYPDMQAMPQLLRTLTKTPNRGPQHDWGYLAAGEPIEPTSRSGMALLIPRVLRGKVVGGSGAVNGANALRPHPSDFASWEEAAGQQWSWDSVRADLIAMEDDHAAGDFHGLGGPIAIQRYSDPELANYNAAFLRACETAGFRTVADLNEPGNAGAGVTPKNRQGDVRWSSALAHLAPARARANLTIRPDTLIDRVAVRAGRVSGVVLATGELITADIVVLAGGAVGSPTILQRSGIGPVALLDRLGITVVAASEEVGANLADHPMYWSRFDARTNADPALSHGQVILVCAADRRSDRQADADLNLIPLRSHPGEIQIAIGLVRPHSRGRVEICSSRAEEPPLIQRNFFTHPQDLDRLVDGVQIARELMLSAEMTRFVGRELAPGPQIMERDGLRAAIRAGADSSYCHLTGTCRMGVDSSTSVVGPDLAVHGLQGLFVVDAAVMPTIPAEPTNMMTMLLAERWARLARKLV